MKKYMFMAGLFSLTLLACSDDDISSAQSDSGSSTIENNSSSSTSDLERSSSLLEESSSSLEKVSSSSKLEISSSSSFHPLCKVSGDWGSRGECSEIWPRGDGDLWSNGDLKVNTSIYIDDTASFGERAGEFFFETDSAEGGRSQIVWSDGKYVLPEFNGLLYAIIQLVRGDLPYNPFCNIGFNIAGFDSSGLAISADISAWNGLCVLYEGSINPTIQLDLGDSVNQSIGYALPSVKVSSQKEPQCFEWNQFKQLNLDEDVEIISGEAAAKKVVRIVFHFQEKPNTEFDGSEGIEFIAIGTNRDE